MPLQRHSGSSTVPSSFACSSCASSCTARLLSLRDQLSGVSAAMEGESNTLTIVASHDDLDVNAAVTVVHLVGLVEPDGLEVVILYRLAAMNEV